SDSSRPTQRILLGSLRAKLSEPRSNPARSGCSGIQVFPVAHPILRLLISRRLSTTAGVEIVPVQDRIEPHREGPLRLPAPERPNGKHHDVPLTDRFVDELSAVHECR